ncbi:uncharacterized protein PITG_20891 [Phytophthora infestans T30-4]|uniref:Endonuclease/exonuclease/phosphatase domain-containing protein n=1 Tax=Phytophthora infestans (strain T30-4) TaxID=403677 RepID=D0P320_PHYIT|nr:uncharacterized protein PITG_20891 [Phytophthora infestans T30-4]EEY58791.1 hypothetical protein PITG_20891 [Phytophthora infestans T30-4]|eukprot:XP_002895299.1 hypothetical protein PITG_20891 [Phytophthora infestans T30-4]
MPQLNTSGRNEGTTQSPTPPGRRPNKGTKVPQGSSIVRQTYSTTVFDEEHNMPQGAVRKDRQRGDLANISAPASTTQTGAGANSGDRGTTGSLGIAQYFDPLSIIEHQQYIEDQFEKEKRLQAQRRKAADRDTDKAHQGSPDDLHPQDQTYGFITQNVNGLGATEKDRDMWFRAFGEQDAHGRADVLLIQETHVAASEVGYHERLYAKRTTHG